VSIENKVKAVLQKVLDVEESEIKPTARLDQSLGIDSTEMVEISVVLKKEFGVQIADNEIKKTHTLNDVVEILKSKMSNSESSGNCGSGCGCHH
jgi:acyl carrier protein